MSEPFFSVVIPAYNRQDFITNTLKSVLAQTYSNFEILIVDDGSVDKTAEVVKKMAGSDQRIKYIWQENSERGAARNNGIKNAKGEYVVFLDSDDEWMSNHLQVLHQKISSLSNVDFIATKYFLRRNGKDMPSSLAQTVEGWYDLDFVIGGAPFACNFCIKRENPTLKIFNSDRKFAVIEDWMFIVENLSVNSIYVIDQVTIIMNDHDDRSMRVNHSNVVKKHLLATEWIEENIPLNKQQTKKLHGNSYYFCAIHSYLDNDRKSVFQYTYKAMKWSGPQIRYFILLGKALIGYPLISKITRR